MMLDSIDEELCYCKISKYADDNKIYAIIRDEQDHRNAQADLDRVVLWARRWGFDLNADKCTVVQFGGDGHWPFFLDGKELQESTMVKDLGVVITNDLKWDGQVSAATSKARTMARSLARAMSSRDPHTWTNLYRTFIRPHFEYASSAWLPHQANHLTTLESVQRWFSRQIPGIGDMNYEERGAVCGLEPVASRIRRGIIVETFKISRGLSGVRQDILTPLTHSHETRGIEAGNYRHLKPRKDIRKFSFAAAAPVLWDEVETEARLAVSVNSFKNTYDRIQRDKKDGSRTKLF